MCSKATCATCKKYTWVGCGMHIDSVKQQVKASLPVGAKFEDNWCACPADKRNPR
jgi:hypothetical protein